MIETFRPLMQAQGREYSKVKKIFAKQAEGGEKIVTLTSDGAETSNTAQAGDFIVRNQTRAGEMYIVPADKFASKYALVQQADDGFHEYRPTGKIIALELAPDILAQLGVPESFRFMAAWGEPMVAKSGDYLATNHQYDEIYRIARQEFFETYQPTASSN